MARTKSATTLPWPPPPQMSTRSAGPLVRIATERLHGGVAILTDPFAAPDVSKRAHQDPAVECQAQVVNIVHVQGELFRPRERIAPIHLSPPGDTRPHRMTTLLLGGIQREVFH